MGAGSDTLSGSLGTRTQGPLKNLDNRAIEIKLGFSFIMARSCNTVTIYSLFNLLVILARVSLLLNFSNSSLTNAITSY